jgi:hypothetical protein
MNILLPNNLPDFFTGEHFFHPSRANEYCDFLNFLKMNWSIETAELYELAGLKGPYHSPEDYEEYAYCLNIALTIAREMSEWRALDTTRDQFLQAFAEQIVPRLCIQVGEHIVRADTWVNMMNAKLAQEMSPALAALLGLDDPLSLHRLECLTEALPG